ncbi:MAG: hypothetical protein K1Y02_13570 [Candidatus Hydrogenedentes bacterium]|nr:hypothetical protein [Candidatus Hydrogenedentota bacterium]
MELSTGERALKALRPVRVLHPTLLSLCPLLGLFAQNLDTVQTGAILRPALVLAGISFLVTAVLAIALRNRYKAGLVTSTLIVSLVVVWGVLEDLISRAIPLYPTMPPVAFYILYAVLALAASGFAVYEYRNDPTRLRVHLFFLAAMLAGGLLIAALVLSPMFGRRAAWIITAYLMITVYAVVVVLRYPDDFQVMTRSANWFSGILLGLYVVVIIYNWPHSSGAQSKLTDLPAPQPTMFSPQTTPDIYFIALDGYGRGDTLRTFYGYNSLPFEEAMNAKGFSFSDKSTSNYLDVPLALTSCLNLEFAHNMLSDTAEPSSASTTELMRLYHQNRLFRYLKNLNYHIVAFSPGIESMEPAGSVDEVLRPPYGLTEFEMVLLNRTIVSRIMEGIYYVRYRNPAAWGFSHLRRRVQFTLNELEKLPEASSDSPRLVYAYLPFPEPPYLLTRDGGLAQPFGPGSLGIDRMFRGLESDYREAYLDQVSYLNKRLDTVTTAIVEKSKRPVCVLIASCRGARVSLNAAEPSQRERFAILTASRFPQASGEGLPQDVGLVNLFRATLNKLFGTSLPLLPNEYLSPPPGEPFKKVVASF